MTQEDNTNEARLEGNAIVHCTGFRVAYRHPFLQAKPARHLHTWTWSPTIGHANLERNPSRTPRPSSSPLPLSRCGNTVGPRGDTVLPVSDGCTPSIFCDGSWQSGAEGLPWTGTRLSIRGGNGKYDSARDDILLDDAPRLPLPNLCFIHKSQKEQGAFRDSRPNVSFSARLPVYVSKPQLFQRASERAPIMIMIVGQKADVFNGCGVDDSPITNRKIRKVPITGYLRGVMEHLRSPTPPVCPCDNLIAEPCMQGK